jgi:hypothetical protein
VTTTRAAAIAARPRVSSGSSRCSTTSSQWFTLALRVSGRPEALRTRGQVVGDLASGRANASDLAETIGAAKARILCGGIVNPKGVVRTCGPTVTDSTLGGNGGWHSLHWTFLAATLITMAIKVEPEKAPPKRRSTQATDDVQLFVELLNRLQRGDVKKLRNELAHFVVFDETHRRSDEHHLVTGELAPSTAEVAQLGFRSLLQFFETRRHLLEDALTAPQVGEVLGVSRQTPLNRVKDNTLLAIRDRGAYRFPAWQFDPQGEDGVIPHLPDVLEALEPQQPFAKLVWLRRPNATLSDREPVDLLRARNIEPVLGAARAAAKLP